MTTIAPCRSVISDRFPVASFAVNVPPDRLFEIACTTHPALLRGDHKHLRTPTNFFTSRLGGLLRAPAGHATYLLPSAQLKRFAGQQRVYYAIGSYRDQRGTDPRFSVSPVDSERVPFVQLAADFSGKALDRRRLTVAAPDGRYGGGAPVLTWGGDQLSIAATQQSQSPPHAAASAAYDDGFSPDLWTRAASSDDTAPLAGARSGRQPLHRMSVPEPSARGEALAEEPPGFEDAPALRLDEDAAVYGGARPRTSVRPIAAPRVYERAPSARAHRVAASEPPGAEHPPVVRLSGSARLGGVAIAEEPPGTEHPPTRHPLVPTPHRRTLKYGQHEAPSLTAPPPAAGTASPGAVAPSDAAEAFHLDGVDDEFDENDDDGDGASGASRLQTTVDGAAAPLTIAEKYRLIVPVARLISGPQNYSAVNADAEFNDPSHAAYQRTHHGLEWGFVLLSQRSGALGRALAACQRRDPDGFREIFGQASAQLLSVTNAPTPEERLQPVDGALLWQEPWLSRFQAAGNVPAFRAAQNEVAIEGYLDPNLEIAFALGFDTDRALAILFDRCVQMGNGAGRRFVLRAVSPLAGPDDEHAALEALGFATVQAFQDSAGLRSTGRMNTSTRAALIGAVRRLGDAAPVAIPTLDQMLDRLVAESRGRRFARRVAALRATSELDDVERHAS